MPELVVEPYDEKTDSIVIEGVRYSGTFFRSLACDGLPVGAEFSIIEREPYPTGGFVVRLKRIWRARGAA